MPYSEEVLPYADTRPQQAEHSSSEILLAIADNAAQLPLLARNQFDFIIETFALDDDGILDDVRVLNDAAEEIKTRRRAIIQSIENILSDYYRHLRMRYQLPQSTALNVLNAQMQALQTIKSTLETTEEDPKQSLSNRALHIVHNAWTTLITLTMFSVIILFVLAALSYFPWFDEASLWKVAFIQLGVGSASYLITKEYDTTFLPSAILLAVCSATLMMYANTTFVLASMPCAVVIFALDLLQRAAHDNYVQQNLTDGYVTKYKLTYYADKVADSALALWQQLTQPTASQEMVDMSVLDDDRQAPPLIPARQS